MKLNEIAAKVAGQHFKVGDIVEFVNDHPLIIREKPHLSKGYVGRVSSVDDQGYCISVEGHYFRYLANRFKLIQKG